MKRLYVYLIFGLLLTMYTHNMQAQSYTMAPGTVNTCTGTSLDPGGTGQYGNSLNVTQTFCSNNGLPIYLQFTSFATESGWDYLYIYDGPTAGATQIGPAYTGNNNPGTVTATGTCITIRFTTDGSVTAAGWAATIGCGAPPPPPPAPAGSTCANPNSFCGQPITYPAGVNNGTAPAGPAYGCLGSQPNPAWFNMQVSQTGPMNFSLNAGADIDYIIWGPFAGPTTACMAGLTAGNIVSCSYSASSSEFPSVPNAIAGQWYMLLITNFSNQNVTISFNQTGGSGQANCNILCNITNMTGVAGPCNNNTFTATGTITTTSPPNAGTLTISSSCGGPPVVLNPPFSTSMNYSLPGIPTTGGNCTITAAYSADPTCTRTVTVVSPASCSSCNVTASNTGPYCPNGTINLAATCTVVPTSTLTTTYSWTGPNGFTSNLQNPAIPAATTAMSGVYSVTASTGTTTCTANTNVVVNATPNVTVTSPTICIGATATITASNATNYSWSAGTTPATGAVVTATPTVTTNYTVTGIDGNGCVGTAVSTVTVNSLPTIVTTSDTICIGGTGTMTATGGTGYTWATGTTPVAGPIVTATPTVTTTYTVNVSDANSCQNSATATITVNPLPIVTASSATVCATFPATITAAGAATYTWSTSPSPSTGASITVTPAATEVFTVTGTDANGCVNTATSTVTVNAAPVVTVASATICINDATPLTANGANGYTWDPPAGLDATTGTTVNANPTATTIYTIIGTDGNGCVDTTTATVTVNPLPNVDAGIQDTVCLGFSTGLTATGAVSYQWTADPTLTGDNTATPTATPTVTTTYSVLGTDGNGCQNTDNVTVLVAPTFTITTAAVPAQCFGTNTGAASVTMNPAQSAGPFANYSIVWQPGGSNAPAIYGLAANSYPVSVTDLAGCVQTATVVVTEPSLLTLSQVASSPVTCNGLSDGSAEVLASGGTQGPAGSEYIYSWSPSAGNAAIASGLSAGAYVATATDANGCTATYNITITQPTPVTLTVSAAATICISQNTTLTANASGGNPGGYTYTWSPAGTISSTSGPSVVASPSVTTTYVVSVVDNLHQCPGGSQSTVITVRPPLVINGIQNEAMCEGDDVVVSVSGSGGNGSHFYEWNPPTGVTFLNGDGSSVRLEPSTTTVYTVRINDNCTNPEPTTNFTLTVHPTPVVAIAPVAPGCEPLQVDSFVATSNPPAAQCTWNLGGVSSASCFPSRTFTQDGSYSISYSVVDINGCTNSTSSTVVVYPVPDAAFLSNPQPTTIIDPVITFTDITFGNITDRIWYFHDSLNTNSTLPAPSYTYLLAGEYPVSLVVETDHGCRDSVTQMVYVTDYYALYVPNAFSPDGDDINEEFRATGTGIEGLETTIYDRWGGKIFTSTDIEKGWNGRDGANNKVDKGVYIYMIIATSFTGEKKQYTGHVTVVR